MVEIFDIEINILKLEARLSASKLEKIRTDAEKFLRSG
jgi:hypothetical protein